MKRTLLIILVCLAAASLFALTMMHKKSKGIVVMELFTSQGCNSCPSAEKVLGNYVNKKDEQIIPIAFHVDYWNRLGWKDSLSDHQYSVRQAYYDAHYLHAGIYTPQLIVNGEKEMIGSEYDRVSKAVADELAELPITTIDIKNVAVENGLVKVEYNIDGTITNSSLNAVLIQDKTTTNVRAGENNGAILVSYNVARGLITDVAKTDGAIAVQLPSSIDTKELSVVLFTQNMATGKITGAVKKGL
jgi:hypothetical protein